MHNTQQTVMKRTYFMAVFCLDG